MGLPFAPIRLPAGSLIFFVAGWFCLSCVTAAPAEDVFHYFEEAGGADLSLSGRRMIGLKRFRNMTRDVEVDWVGGAMETALAEMMEKGGGRVRVLESEDFEKERKVNEGKIDLAELERRMVKSLGIQAVVRGEYRRSKRGVYLFSCHLDTPGSSGGGVAISESGRLDEIFEVQSRLSERLCAALGLSPPDVAGGERVGLKPYEYYQKALSAPDGSYRRLHYCMKALEEDPEYVLARFSLAEAYYLIGISYGNRECLDRALKEYRGVLASEPHHPKALYKIGMVLFLKGEYEGSRDAFERALADSPGMAEAQVGLRRLTEMGR